MASATASGRPCSWSWRHWSSAPAPDSPANPGRRHQFEHFHDGNDSGRHTVERFTEPKPLADPASSAKAAYVRYVQAVDRAYAAPEKATREQLSQVATNGALTFLLSQVQALREDRVHQQGRLRIKKMAVTSVSPASGKHLAQAFLEACIDYSHRAYVDGKGKPVFPREQGSGLARATVNMVHIGDSWLVADEQNPPVKSC